MAARARLTVSRNGTDDVGDRQVILTLDAERWTSLVFGGSATREVEPGPHRLRADNTLFRKTIEFEVGEGEEARFVTSSREGPLSGLFLLIGAPFYYVDLRRE